MAVGKPHRSVHCMVTGADVPLSQAVPVDLVRDSLVAILRQKVQDWDPNGYVCLNALNEARMRHFTDLISADDGELRDLQEQVADSLRDQEIVSSQPDLEYDSSETRGQRIADKVAKFGGSWAFIGAFGAVLLIWIVLNAVALGKGAFDPYPFILLNLILSCTAAIQAPVIMMSQNRQEQKDRKRSQNDYKVNLKAELEIQHLHEKLDKLINDQWKHLLEIQQMQMDMIEEMTKK